MKRTFLLVPALLIGLGLPLLSAVTADAAPAPRAVVIQSQAGTNQVVDILGGSTASKAPAQTHTANGSLAQSFVFTNCDTSGWCEIRNSKSDKCLDVQGARTARGTLVQQYRCNLTKAQQWLPVDMGNGLQSIQSAIADDRWLEVRGGKAKDGARLDIWSSNGTSAQLFRLADAPDWGLSYAQVDQSTSVTATFADLKSIAPWATELRVTARLNYGSATTRTVAVTQRLSTLSSDASFTWDVGDYGKWSISAAFYKGSTKLMASSAVSLVVDANEYIVAPLTGTMPVTMLTTSLWGQGSIRGSDNHIPVIARLARANQWNWNALPTGVHAVPYLTKEQYSKPVSGAYLNDNLAPIKAYIKDLHALNSASVFHLYVNDYHAQMVQSLLYANKIPPENYTITLLSDGNFSYNKFAEVYGADAEAANTAYTAQWNDAKAYAYQNGAISPALSVGAAQNSIYAAVQSEPTAHWWLTRPALLTSPGDSNAFAAKAIANPQVVALNINTKLTDIKTQGAQAMTEFKNLYRFNDAYFAQSTASGKRVMMFLGARLNLEASFNDYARFTMKYYGTACDYYYKGHPATPTATSPDKKAQLAALRITDVDSSVPAELILFFNPDIYMSGYPSSTYMSVNDPEMPKGLFTLTKQQGLASSNPDYSIMAWFMAPKSSYSGAIASLPGDFVVEFSAKVATKEGYDIAMWRSSTGSITFFKLVGEEYQEVGSK